jgi:hypothetical protein
MAKNQVVIEVIGENTALRKSLGDSEKRVRQLEKQIGRAGKGGAASMGGLTKSMGITAAATIGASKAFGFFEKAVDRTESLTKATLKLSKQTGMDNVAAAQFVQLADARGISSEKLGTSFGALSKSMYAATHGGKKQAEVFAQLGVSQKALQSGDLNTVLMQVSDGLKNQGSNADRLALSQKLLGRGGKDLMGVFAGGSKTLQEQLGMYKQNADAIARDSKSTMEMAANKRKLTAALDSIKITLGTAVIPFMNKASAALVKFSNLSPEVKKLIVTMIGFAAAAVAMSKIIVVVKNIAGAFKLLTAIPKIFLAIRQAFFILKLAMMSNPFIAVAMIAVAAGILIYTKWNTVKKYLMVAWDAIKVAFHAVAKFIVSAAKSGFLGPVGWIIANWGRVVKFFSGLPGRLGGYAKSAGSAIWNGLKSGASSVLGFVKGIFNSVIGVIESGINNVIGGMNKGIKLFNKLPGPDVGLVGTVSMPRLAEGGIVTRPTVALIGEAGPEAVVPLKRARSAGFVAGGSTYTFNIYNQGNALDESALAAKIGWQLATRSVS